MKYFLIIIFLFIGIKGNKEKNKTIYFFIKNYKYFFEKTYSNNNIKITFPLTVLSTAIFFYLKKRKIISTKKTIAGIIASFLPLKFSLYKSFIKTLEEIKEKENNQTPVKKTRLNILEENINNRKRKPYNSFLTHRSEPSKQFEEPQEDSIIFFSGFSS